MKNLIEYLKTLIFLNFFKIEIILNTILKKDALKKRRSKKKTHNTAKGINRMIPSSMLGLLLNKRPVIQTIVNIGKVMNKLLRQKRRISAVQLHLIVATLILLTSYSLNSL